MLGLQSQRRIEKLLMAIQVIAIGGAVSLCVVALFIPPTFASPIDNSKNPIGQVLSDAPAVTLDQLSSLWERDLRQRLIDPPPKPKPVSKVVIPKPENVTLPKLQATFVEDKLTWGLFVDSKGVSRVLAAGSSVDQFEIVRITTGKAELRRGTKAYDVKIPKSPGQVTRLKRRR